DAPRTRLRFLGADNRFHMFALVRETQGAPSLVRTGRFQRLHEIGGWRHLALLGIELEPHGDHLAALESRRFAIAPSKRDARRSADRADRAAIGVAVERHLHRR